MKRTRTMAVLCGLLVSIVCPAEAGIPPARVGQRWALIVSTGGASRGNAQALARLLTESYGFGSDAVVLLNDAQATGGRIQDEMSRLQERVQPFDALFVYLSLDLRPDPSGGFSFLPADTTSVPWSWMPAQRVFGWLSQLPVGSGLVVYPSCSERFDETLAGELRYGTRPGSIELLRVCERSSLGRPVPDPRGSEQWRARLMGQLVNALKEIASRRAPVPTWELAATLRRSLKEGLLNVRRVPEYIQEGFVFEPVARGVAGKQVRYRSASSFEEQEAVLRNIPGIVRTAPDPVRESELAARFLGEVALDANAGVGTQLEPPARLTLRTAAVEALGDLRADPARDALDMIAQQAADAPFVRRAALTQLSRLLPARAPDLAAARAAFADPDPSVRETAVRTAVILNDAAAVALLQAQLGTETESAVRVAIVQALAALGTEDRAALIRLLQDPDAAVRGETATALGRLGLDEATTAALLERLRNDASTEVRRQAAYALARTREEARIVNRPPEVRPGLVASGLLDALRTGPSPVREAAAYALGRTGGPGTEDALRALLRDGETEAERVAAAEALGQLKSVAAFADLANALRDPERPGLRRAAAVALGVLGTPDALPPLAAALDDSDPYVQRQAQQSLEQIPLSRDRLGTVLEDQSPRIRLAAVRLAGRSNDPEMVASLIGALADSDAEVRQAAITALGAYRDPASVDRVVNAAKLENRLTQSGVLSVLASIPDLKAFQAVLALAKESKDPELRVGALGALGSQVEWLRQAVVATTPPDPAASRALSDAANVALDAAKQDSVAVRMAATAALAASREGLMRLLELATKDPSSEVRSAAIEQLRRAGPPIQ